MTCIVIIKEIPIENKYKLSYIKANMYYITQLTFNSKIAVSHLYTSNLLCMFQKNYFRANKATK